MESNSTTTATAQLTVRSPLETALLAEKIASALHAGDILILDGDLAAGKTYFTKALVASMKSSELVTSPTYALVQLYPTSVATIVHVDAYRIESLAEFEDLGLVDYIEESITIIEWGEKVGELFPDALHLRFDRVDSDPNQRLIRVFGSTARWAPVVSSLSSYGQISDGNYPRN